MRIIFEQWCYLILKVSFLKRWFFSETSNQYISIYVLTHKRSAIVDNMLCTITYTMVQVYIYLPIFTLEFTPAWCFDRDGVMITDEITYFLKHQIKNFPSAVSWPHLLIYTYFNSKYTFQMYLQKINTAVKIFWATEYDTATNFWWKWLSWWFASKLCWKLSL